MMHNAPTIQCGDKESERVLKFEHAPHRGKTRPYSVKQTLATTPAPLSPSSVSTATGTEDDMLAEIGVMASAVMTLSKMSSRPLPTPPAAKYVRWATHNEVLEIQNIDELIMLGYYDDYDSDLGWDYRDESLDDEVDGSLGNDASDEDEDEDDDLHHYLNDNERSSSEEQVQKTVESKGEQSRQPVNYYDLVCHHQRQTQQLQFQYQPQSLQNLRQIQQQHPPQAHSGGQVEIESELSVMDAKSEMAEDELIRSECLYISTPWDAKFHNLDSNTRTGTTSTVGPFSDPDRDVWSSGAAVQTSTSLKKSTVRLPLSPSFSTSKWATSEARSTLSKGAGSTVYKKKDSGRTPFPPPRLSSSYLPLTGLFAVNKPAGLTSTTLVDYMQHVCKRNQDHALVKGVLRLDDSKRAKKQGLVKIGHGGTLDPLARGVVGMGSGTKKLHKMSASSKIYIAEGRFGFSTRTLDCTGSLVSTGPTDHITKDKLLQTLESFKGEISQTPPLYSALRIDGKRLYDYAREGVPLPKEIPSRKVQVHALDLLSYTDAQGTQFSHPSLKVFGFQGNSGSDIKPTDTTVSSAAIAKSLDLAPSFSLKRTSISDSTYVPVPPSPKGVYFHIRLHCSSGTYVRTMISDIAAQLGTVAHMTDLLRVEQSGFKLEDKTVTLEMKECEDLDRVDTAIRMGNRIYKEREAKQPLLS
ncbi:hypothetical protein EDD11_004939 [Mortierella claussenii]|nr:hypothetical protein EDD11_004939 [Mortierella claussenii]